MASFLVDEEGYYGEFGGAYVPEILHKCVEELQKNYLSVLQSKISDRNMTGYCVIRRTSFSTLPCPPPVGEVRLQDLSEARRPEPYRCPQNQ